MKPRLDRDPNAKFFGYIPPEGLKITPVGGPTLVPSEPGPDAAAPDQRCGSAKKEEDAAAKDEKKPEGDEPKF